MTDKQELEQEVKFLKWAVIGLLIIAGILGVVLIDTRTELAIMKGGNHAIQNSSGSAVRKLRNDLRGVNMPGMSFGRWDMA